MSGRKKKAFVGNEQMRNCSAGNLCSMVLFVPSVFSVCREPLALGAQSIRPCIHPPVRPSVTEADTDSGEA